MRSAWKSWIAELCQIYTHGHFRIFSELIGEGIIIALYVFLRIKEDDALRFLGYGNFD